MCRSLVLGFAALVALAVTGCSKGNGPDAESFVYPLAVGNEWVYQCESYCVGAGCDYDTIRCSIVVRVAAIDTPVSSPAVYRIEAQSFYEDDGVWGGKALYQNGADGMYCLALEDTGHATYFARPKVHAGAHAPSIFPLDPIWSHSPVSGGLHTGGLEWYDPPLVVLHYPLKGEWRYITAGLHHVADIDKAVVGREKITVRTGTYDCFKIAWLYPDSIDIDCTECVSDCGLVSRTWRMPIATNSPPGDTLPEWIVSVELQRVELVEVPRKPGTRHFPF